MGESRIKGLGRRDLIGKKMRNMQTMGLSESIYRNGWVSLKASYSTFILNSLCLAVELYGGKR